MSLQVVKTERDEFADHCVTRLEDALEIAKANPQESLILFMVGRDGEITQGYTSLDRVRLAGHLYLMLHNVGGDA